MVEEEIINAEEIKKDEKEEKTEMNKLRTILFIIFSFVLVGIIISIKANNPEFSIWWIIIIIILISGIGLVGAFWDKLHRWYSKSESKEKEDKLPEPASEEELLKKIESIPNSMRYQDHLKEILNTHKYNVGKNTIYHFETQWLYTQPKMHIIVNAHYPEELPTVLAEPNTRDITLAVNNMSKSPKDDPIIVEEEVENQMLGISQKKKSTIPSKKKQKTEQKKEEKII